MKFYPCTGAGAKVAGKTLGSLVTEKLCLQFVPVGSCIYLYMDNYFTSLPLMNALSNNWLFCVGRIQTDRTEKAPLQDISKAERGTCCAVEDKENEIPLLRWHDNSQVNLVTNLKDEKAFHVGSCKQWKKSEKNRVSVPQRNIVKLYNKQIGSVDLFAKMRGHYRVRIRSKKLYWPLLGFASMEVLQIYGFFSALFRVVFLF